MIADIQLLQPLWLGLAPLMLLVYWLYQRNFAHAGKQSLPALAVRHPFADAAMLINGHLGIKHGIVANGHIISHDHLGINNNTIAQDHTVSDDGPGPQADVMAQIHIFTNGF